MYLPDRILIAVSDVLDAVATFTAVLTTIAFAAVMLMGVFFRYVLNSSLSWSDEAALVLFGWAAFLFIASAYLHGKHIHLDIFVRRMSATWQTRVSTLAEGLAGGYLIALLIACIQAMEVIAKGRTDALQLPMTLHFIAIPVAVSVMMVHWMRRNAAGAPLQTAMLKLGIAVAYFCIVFAPVGNTCRCLVGCACRF